MSLDDFDIQNKFKHLLVRKTEVAYFKNIIYVKDTMDVLNFEITALIK